jgi:hypothetical protein
MEQSIFHEVGGKRLVRVTAALPFNPPPGSTPEDLAKWRQRGTFVHRATEMFDKDTLDWDTMDTDLEPFVRGWEKAVSDLDIHNILAIEARVWSKKYLYAGTLDRLLLMGRWAWLIDIKTGPPMPTDPLQTAAYRQAAHETDLCSNTIRRGCIHLSKDGGYKLVKHNNPEDLYDFLAKMRSLKWDLRYKYRVEN